MNWAKLFVLCLCGALVVDRHGVVGQLMCMDGETLSVNIALCTAANTCIPASVTGRFLFAIATLDCVVTADANGMLMVAGTFPCISLILTCVEDATTTTAATTAATTTAVVGSPESAESGGASSRRR